MNNEILVVDDKVSFCKSLARNFDQLGYKTHYCHSEKDALKIIKENNIKAILQDISMGEENGVEILKSILKKHPEMQVIMMTGYATLETAVECMKLGAVDFLEKPLNFEKLFKVVENTVRLSTLNNENKELHERINELSGNITTQNPLVLELCKKAAKFAETELSVLIYGESGTGKEHLAEFIHNHSTRSSKKMIQINCAAFPDNLLDNELFGHEKGAYTGADKRFHGVFEQADSSTLHLDEIGDMSLATQAKILRTLQNSQIQRLGGNETISVNFRLITSTNKNLQDLISNQSFREDLFYRLNAVILHTIPLRERKDDIPLLAAEFLKGTKIKGLSQEVISTFFNYDWPGNIRELKNAVNYAAAICSGELIEAKDLPPSFETDNSELIQNTKVTGSLENNEKKLILQTLQETNYNKVQTAEKLKISRKTLYNKMKKYDL